MMTVEQTRAKLKSIPRASRCHPKCKGWEIFEVNRHEGYEIEGCDDCLACALGLVAEWLESGKSTERIFGGIADVLRDAGYDNNRW